MMEGTVDVHVEEREVVFKGVVDELASHRNSGVLHDYVDLLALLFESVDQVVCDLRHVLEIDHVQLDHLGFLGVRAGFSDSFKFASVSRSQYDIGAVLIELIGHVLSDPRGGAGDPNDLPLVVGRGSLPPDVGY